MSPSQEPRILFESEKRLSGVAELPRLRDWITQIANQENHQIERIAYFFVSDDELLKMNNEFLSHDELTDILTFPYSYDPIAADIYISFDRVADNAIVHNCEAEEELRRVIIHGVLHMCGWKDKTEEESTAMRKRENDCLILWSKI